MTDPTPVWDDAKLALTLLAIDPEGLGGIWLRARPGPVRERFLGAVGLALAPNELKRVYPDISDDQLFGGLDLTATLDLGKTVMTPGILNTRGISLLVTMAERCNPGLIARLCVRLDEDGAPGVVALDEGVEDETLHPALAHRLAFHLDFESLSHRDCPDIQLDHDRIDISRRFLSQVASAEHFAGELAVAAVQFGIADIRGPLLVMRAARALAAIKRQTEVTEDEIATCARLILGPRATQIPEQPIEDAETETAPPPSDTTEQSEATRDQIDTVPPEMVLQAISANLPSGLLDRLAAQQAKQSAKGADGSGASHKGNRRGRPKPSQRGRLGGAARIDLLATLRSAAPWQTMRKRAKYAPKRPIHIRSDDIRLRKFEEKSDRLLIFVVDASGSAALARLGEAKGAVELLLSEAYSRRDHVALIAFRGETADLLLPPTRSLVQTKRRLAALPGGGGTPLAKGMEAALQLAISTRNKGLTPTIALLTDGRANIALDGSANRTAAGDDAKSMARLIRSQQTPALVIDTGTRPHASLKDLAHDLAAPYLPLPRADAHRVSQAIETILE